MQIRGSHAASSHLCSRLVRGLFSHTSWAFICPPIYHPPIQRSPLFPPAIYLSLAAARVCLLRTEVSALQYLVQQVLMDL